MWVFARIQLNIIEKSLGFFPLRGELSPQTEDLTLRKKEEARERREVEADKKKPARNRRNSEKPRKETRGESPRAQKR